MRAEQDPFVAAGPRCRRPSRRKRFFGLTDSFGSSAADQVIPGRASLTRPLRRSAGYRVLPGLHLAANSLKASLNDLGGGAPFRSIDARRLCAASLCAGRLIGYLEALEATDRRLARDVAGELADVIASVDRVRRQFERATG
jgi:hypothetical protein